MTVNNPATQNPELGYDYNLGGYLLYDLEPVLL